MSSVFTIENRFKKSYFLWLIFLLVLKAGISLLLIAFYNVNLAPDEAQYWTWSQALDWGYYSKPPAIAWQIFLTTSFLGNNEFGIRFGAVLVSFFLPLVIFATAQASELSPRASFWAGVVTAFSPLGIFLSFIASTDGGMMLFLSLGILAVVKGIYDDDGPNYPIVGGWILLGALYKWTAFILWPVTLFFLLFYPRLRKWSILFGILISLCALIPILYWNAGHDWATFRHVGRTVIHKASTHGSNFFDFFFAQIGLLSPVYWVLLILSYFYMRSKSVIYCAAFPFLLVVYFIMALVKHMQPNWAAFLYPVASIPIAWYSIEKIRSGRIWLHLGTWLAVLFSTFAIAIPLMQEQNFWSALPIPYKANPFRQNVGWSNLPKLLEQSGYNPKTDFLFGDKYQTASLLSFYAPTKKLAYFFNLNGDRKNQFSYWEKMESREIGNTGFFVVVENTKEEALFWYRDHYLKKLKPYFAKIEFLGASPLFSAYKKPVKFAMIFKCLHYGGEAPQDPEKY
ncbi:MAG: ArnT family glycosyltransferase [Chlamydiales bacterium]